MSRTKSSNIARLKDLIKQIIAIADDLSAEHDNLIMSSARLKEIEPALLKLRAALKSPAITFDNIPTTDGPSTIETSNNEPHKDKTEKRQRTRKIILIPVHTDEEIPPE